METINGDDSDDGDIFVLKRWTPIGKLTKRRAHEIKEKVLGKANFCCNEVEDVNVTIAFDKFSNNKQTDKETNGFSSDGEISILEEKVNKPVVSNVLHDKQDKTPKIKNATPKKSPSKTILDYFSPIKRLYDESESSDYNVNKKIKIENQSVTEPIAFENLRNNAITTCINESSHDNSPENNVDNAKQKNISETNYYYSRSMKKIIHHEILNQKSLESKASAEGRKFESLITVDEYNSVTKFLQLPNNAVELFTRMLCRKKGWHRVSNIKYEDIVGDEEEVLKILNCDNFVDLDIKNETIETLLNLLNKAEVEKLCKSFKVKSKAGSKKGDLINAFLKNIKTQKSMTDMWGNERNSKREILMKTEILQVLGTCMKLNESFLKFLNRMLLLFSLPHYVPDEDKWNAQIRKVADVCMKIVLFPSYEVKPIVIFQCRSDFIFYEKAMELLSEFEGAIDGKKVEEFPRIARKANKEFKDLLMNNGYKERVKSLPSFLRRYNAGSVYAKILTVYCEKYKKNKTSDEIIEIMEMLIDQDVFLMRKRGKWYNLLVIAYTNSGNYEKAGKALLSGLKDDLVNNVEVLLLQQRGESLLKKKKNGIKEEQLREELRKLCTVTVTEPLEVEIKAKAFDNGEPGFKSVYSYVNCTGTKTFTNVEEIALNHYKNNGFPRGIHAEGSIIQTMYFLVFFDIIYNLSPPGVFQNSYQTQPLDFSSRSFYTNRKTEIDSRIEEMRSWSVEKFESTIKDVYKNYLGYSCVITWRDNYTPGVFCEVLRCLGTAAFTSICERLAQNYGVFNSGFPDLTVWNPQTGVCKFVEVKSPNDKLSPKQRLWLDFLRKINVYCEVCKVKNVASLERTLKKSAPDGSDNGGK